MNKIRATFMRKWKSKLLYFLEMSLSFTNIYGLPALMAILFTNISQLGHSIVKL